MARFTKQALLSLVLLASAEAFQPGFIKPVTTRSTHALFMSAPDQEEPAQNRGVLKRLSSKMKPFGVGLLTAASIGFSQLAPAQAATPLPKAATMPDAEKTAMRSIQIEMDKKNQIEIEDYNKRARQIEAKDGSKAREIFEKEYKEAKEQRDQDLQDELEELQRGLLDRGIDPFNDMEGYRQSFLLKKGKNLAEVEGTDQYADAQIVKMGLTKQSYTFQKATNRQLIKMMNEDYKNRGIDPFPEFANKDNHQKHANIIFMPKTAATKKLASWQENMVKFGQIEPPKTGELSLKEQLELDPDLARRNEEKLNKATFKGDEKDKEAAVKAAAKAKAEGAKAKIKAAQLKAKETAKEEAKAVKDEAKAVKEKTKEEARVAKEAEKEQKRIAKDQAKNDKEAVKIAAATAAAAAGVAAASQAVGGSVTAGLEAAKETVQAAVDGGTEIVSSDTVSMEDFEDDSKFQEEYGADVVRSEQKKGVPLVGKVGGLVAVAVGGKFVIDRMSQPSASDEEERQRQFNLLMGITDKGTGKGKDVSGAIDTTATDAIDVDTEALSGDVNGDIAAPAPSPPAPQPEAAAEPKKRGLGMRSMFKKNKNDRETDLNVLMSQSATAPEVAMLLSKLLTFGAPGRFPRVNALAGGMPMEEFDLEKAKSILEASTEKAGISREEGAEVFANVVNCMLIDIIDLASSSLGKSDDVTFDATNIVIDFMNHAASLYDAVADGVEITPVTYGGNLAKSKLELMYGAYAFSGMMKMEEDMNDRIELLRNVFAITEKKAEGIITNATQKNMMEMMKTEEGQKQMADMMGGMEGMEGMEGMAGMMGGGGGGEGGEEPSPEQLKEMLTMLKTMKDSGSIPPEELATVREQFRESFGSSIDDILKQADSAGGEMSGADKELLDLMQSILED